MKKLLLSFFLVFVISAVVFAHPGRTDKNGGHYNRETGEYHYHHGYPAHQHTGGVCPYNFDDQTGISSYPYQSEENTAINEKPYVVQSKTAETKKTSYLPFYKIFLCLFASVIAFGGSCAIKEKIKEQKLRKEFLPLYQGKSMSQLAGVPDWAEVDSMGFPHSKNAKDQAHDFFTVYTSKNGKCYHQYFCKTLRSPVRSMNICEAKAKGLSPCQICKPMQNAPAWADAYRKIHAIKCRYKIPMNP